MKKSEVSKEGGGKWGRGDGRGRGGQEGGGGEEGRWVVKGEMGREEGDERRRRWGRLEMSVDGRWAGR